MTTQTIPIEQAVAPLAELGTAEAVAEFLHAEGVKGVRGNAGECPLALYLSHVSGESVVIDTGTWETEGPIPKAGDLPEPLADFVRLFDDFERFPELEWSDDD